MDARPRLLANALCAAMAVLGAIALSRGLASMALRTAETAAVGAAPRIGCGWGCGSSRTKNNVETEDRMISSHLSPFLAVKLHSISG